MSALYTSCISAGSSQLCGNNANSVRWYRKQSRVNRCGITVMFSVIVAKSGVVEDVREEEQMLFFHFSWYLYWNASPSLQNVTETSGTYGLTMGESSSWMVPLMQKKKTWHGCELDALFWSWCIWWLPLQHNCCLVSESRFTNWLWYWR